jgi:hypothetical protein
MIRVAMIRVAMIRVAMIRVAMIRVAWVRVAWVRVAMVRVVMVRVAWVRFLMSQRRARRRQLIQWHKQAHPHRDTPNQRAAAAPFAHQHGNAGVAQQLLVKAAHRR